MKILGHRGASAHATENTLEAFRRARTDGADGVELDVLLCATGELVVFHDDNLSRLAGRPEAVASLPLAALREVRLASGGTIPTLDEVLEETRGMYVNVELKAASGLGARDLLRLAGAVARSVRRQRAEVIVSSFNPFALLACRTAAPEIPRGMLVHAFMSRPLRDTWLRTPVAPRALHPEQSFMNATRVRAWKAAGLEVNAWTVGDLAGLVRAAALGVDAIITNDPAWARQALGERGRQSLASPS